VQWAIWTPLRARRVAGVAPASADEPPGPHTGGVAVLFTPPQGGTGPFQQERRLLAFVLRRGRPVALVPLGEARALDGAVVSWWRALDTRQGGALQTVAAELGRRVWEPLRPHLGDARTVLIAPDGGLSFIPFAALPGSKPGSYLIEDLAI